MKIRNYIVENYQLLMDCLEKELCKNGISYVRIDNEIHFQNQIIRFYDIELDIKEIISWLFTKIEIEDPIERFVLNPMVFNNIELLPEEKRFTNLEKNYQSRNKFIQKQESNMVNQKLKRYKR